ncbi:hypothetical protein ACQJBY_022806 [Aegilops geniculata]
MHWSSNRRRAGAAAMCWCCGQRRAQLPYIKRARSPPPPLVSLRLAGATLVPVAIPPAMTTRREWWKSRRCSVLCAGTFATELRRQAVHGAATDDASISRQSATTDGEFATTVSIVKSATTNAGTWRSCISDAKILRLALFFAGTGQVLPQVSTRLSCIHDDFFFQFATTGVLVCWKQFQFLLQPPIFALLEEHPILHFFYQWHFGLLEPFRFLLPPLFWFFARTSPYFCWKIFCYNQPAECYNG